MEVQSVVFPRTFSKNAMADFLHKEQLIPLKGIDRSQSNWWRVRITDPEKYKGYITKILPKSNIHLVIGYMNKPKKEDIMIGSGEKVYYGIRPLKKGQRHPTIKEAFDNKQIRYFGLHKVSDVYGTLPEMKKKDLLEIDKIHKMDLINAKEDFKEKVYNKIVSMEKELKNIISMVDNAKTETEYDKYKKLFEVKKKIFDNLSNSFLELNKKKPKIIKRQFDLLNKINVYDIDKEDLQSNVKRQRTKGRVIRREPLPTPEKLELDLLSSELPLPKKSGYEKLKDYLIEKYNKSTDKKEKEKLLKNIKDTKKIIIDEQKTKGIKRKELLPVPEKLELDLLSTNPPLTKRKRNLKDAPTYDLNKMLFLFYECYQPVKNNKLARKMLKALATQYNLSYPLTNNDVKLIKEEVVERIKKNIKVKQTSKEFLKEFFGESATDYNSVFQEYDCFLKNFPELHSYIMLKLQIIKKNEKPDSLNKIIIENNPPKIQDYPSIPIVKDLKKTYGIKKEPLPEVEKLNLDLLSSELPLTKREIKERTVAAKKIQALFRKNRTLKKAKAISEEQKKMREEEKKDLIKRYSPITETSIKKLQDDIDFLSESLVDIEIEDRQYEQYKKSGRVPPKVDKTKRLNDKLKPNMEKRKIELVHRLELFKEILKEG
jgi:hypothetical protein